MGLAVGVLDAIAGWLQSWSSVIGGLGSVLLTAGLVYLYLRQTRLQERQTEIQERQQQLSESQAQPVVEVGAVDVEGDQLYVTLSNGGGGIAKNLEIVTEVDFQPTSDIEPVETQSPLSELVAEEYGDELNVDEIGRSLRPYETNSTFVGTPLLGVRLEDGTVRRYGFLEGVRELEEHGVEELSCRISIRYADLFDEVRSTVVAGGGGAAVDGTVLSNLVKPVDEYR